jgi:GNAT superfamily N-acetyltransferase
MHYQRTHISQPLVFRTRGGQLVAVRQATAVDTLLLADMLCRLSERTRHLRYMRSGYFSSEAIWSEAVRMTRGHPPDHTTLVATIRPNDDDEAVAVAELFRDPHDPTGGEIALVVRDDVQQQGIGSFLLWRLIRVAQRSGIIGLSASMLAENIPMLRPIRAPDLPYTATTLYGETQVLVRVPAQSGALTSAPHLQKLAA